MNIAFQSGAAYCYGEEYSGPACTGCFSHGLLELFDNRAPECEKEHNLFT